MQGQAPKNDDFAPFPPTLLTRIWSLKPAAKRAQKKKKKVKKSPKQQNIVNSKPKSKISGLEALDEDARWKHEAGKRLKEVELRDGSEEEKAQFQAEEMEKLKNWNFDPVKMKDAKKPSFWRKMGAYTAWGMGKRSRRNSTISFRKRYGRSSRMK